MALIQVANVLKQSQLNTGTLTYNITDVDVVMAEAADTAGTFKTGDPAATPPIEEGGDKPGALSVQTDQDVNVTFKWKQTGQFANTNLPVRFHCKAVLEHMGKAVTTVGSEVDDADFVETVDFEIGQDHEYTKIVQINGLNPGIYHVYALFTLELLNDPNILGPNESSNTPVAGFADLGVINIYKAN